MEKGLSEIEFKLLKASSEFISGKNHSMEFIKSNPTSSIALRVDDELSIDYVGLIYFGNCESGEITIHVDGGSYQKEYEGYKNYIIEKIPEIKNRIKYVKL